MVEPEEDASLLSTNGNNTSQSYGGTSGSETHGENVDVLKEDFRSYLAYVIPMAIGILLVSVDGTIVISSYAAIGSELQQLQNTSWIATAYLMTQTSFQPLLGKLSDIFGRKTCLLTCYAIFGLGCLFCGMATTMTQLIAARALAGVGAGGMTSLVTMIMSDVVPLRIRGTWQAVLNIVYNIGSACGAPLGGVLTDTIGWRWAFLLQVPLCLVAFISVSFTLHLPTKDSSRFSDRLKRIDFGGAATLICAVFFLLFGLDYGGNVGWSNRLTFASLALFVAFTTIFVFIEGAIAKEPFLPKRVILDRPLLASYFANCFGMAASLTQIFYAALFFQAVQGKSVLEGSVWLIICVCGSLIGSITGGLVIQHTGRFYLICVIGYFLLFFGTVFVYIFSGVIVDEPWTLGIAAGLFISNLGNGSGVTTTLISIIANAGKEDQALATAASYLFRSLGCVVGLSAGSSIIQNSLRFWLKKMLTGTGQDVEEIVRRVRESLDYVNQLDPDVKATVVLSYKNAVQVTFLFTVFMSALAALSSLFIKEKALSVTRS